MTLMPFRELLVAQGTNLCEPRAIGCLPVLVAVWRAGRAGRCESEVARDHGVFRR
jgi:hypothetical protein